MFVVGIQSGLLSFRMFEAEFGADGDPVPDGASASPVNSSLMNGPYSAVSKSVMPFRQPDGPAGSWIFCPDVCHGGNSFPYSRIRERIRSIDFFLYPVSVSLTIRAI